MSSTKTNAPEVRRPPSPLDFRLDGRTKLTFAGAKLVDPVTGLALELGPDRVAVLDPATHRLVGVYEPIRVAPARPGRNRVRQARREAERARSREVDERNRAALLALEAMASKPVSVLAATLIEPPRPASGPSLPSLAVSPEVIPPTTEPEPEPPTQIDPDPEPGPAEPAPLVAEEHPATVAVAASSKPKPTRVVLPPAPSPPPAKVEVVAVPPTPPTPPPSAPAPAAKPASPTTTTTLTPTTASAGITGKPLSDSQIAALEAIWAVNPAERTIRVIQKFEDATGRWITPEVAERHRRAAAR